MSVPRPKRFNQKQRLASARGWLHDQKGKNVARAYRKHFGVDWATAFRELELLGIQIPSDYRENILKSVAASAEAKKRKKAEKLAALSDIEQDEIFAYIAGYTDGGAPYGITWDECDDLYDLGEQPD